MENFPNKPDIYYKQKLNEYAIDTVEYQSLSGIWTYRVNQKGRSFVVVNKETHFIIYNRFASSSAYDDESIELFFAKIDFVEDDITINILWRSWAKVWLGIIGALIAASFLYYVFTKNWFVVCLLVIGVLILTNWLLRDKRLFQVRMLTFLKSL